MPIPDTGRQELVHRFQYHPPMTDQAKRAHEDVREECKRLALFLSSSLPAGREKSLAITKLEEAMMWANAAIARHVGSEGGTR